MCAVTSAAALSGEGRAQPGAVLVSLAAIYNQRPSVWQHGSYEIRLWRPTRPIRGSGAAWRRRDGRSLSARDTARSDRRHQAAERGPGERRGPGVEQFRHEARVIARITHPNICTLRGVGEDGSAIFLVMNTSMARRSRSAETVPYHCRSCCAPRSDRRRAGSRASPGRGASGSQSQQHHADARQRRLLDWPGQVAGARGASPHRRDQERTGGGRRSSGTVPYMAPEQIEGHAVDARTDIFSFGVVLYEMLAGKRPFAGDSRASLMAAIVASEPPALSSLQPRTPAALERLINRCLAKEPDDRWQTARDLAAELRWIAELGSGATTAAPVTIRRSRRAALWGAVAGVVLAAAVFQRFCRDGPALPSPRIDG